MYFNIFYVTISNTTIYLIYNANYYFLPIQYKYRLQI